MSSGFITESEIAERRRARQEEWEKVRKPDQPAEAPEEEYDHRSLYERLQANKQKRDLEYEEAHRLKNMIKGLDDDEVEFLDLVDRSKLEEERKKSLEEAREMAEFRSKVACLHEESLTERIQMEIQRNSQSTTNKIITNSSKSSQSKLLAGAVVKKRPGESADPASPAKRLKQSTTNKTKDIEVEVVEAQSREALNQETEAQSREALNHESGVQSREALNIRQTNVKQINQSNQEKKTSPDGNCKHIKVGGMTCIGILPGLGHYRTESSDEVDSDDSSDLEDPESPAKVAKFDLVGRKIKKKTVDME